MFQIFIKPFEFRANSDLASRVAQINLIITFLLIGY